MRVDISRRLSLKDIHTSEVRTVNYKDYLITSRESVSVADLSGGNLPKRKDIGRMPEPYRRLGKTPFDVLSITNQTSGKKEYVMVMPSLHAADVNWVLYAAGANKDDGFNTRDIFVHSQALEAGRYERSSDAFAQRTRSHDRIPGWSDFQNNGGENDIVELLSQNIRYDYTFQKRPKGTLTPVVRWTIEDGIPQIVVDPLEPELAEAISYALPHKTSDGDRLSTVLGLPFIGTFSPDVRVPQYGRYNPTSPMLQEIGAIQMMPYFFLMLAQARMPGSEVGPAMDLQQSRLFTATTAYLESGKLPSSTPEREPKLTRNEIVSNHVWKQFEELDLTRTREYSLPNGGFIKVDIDSDGNRSLRKSRVGGPRYSIVEHNETIKGQTVKVTTYEFDGTTEDQTGVTFTLTTSEKGSKMTIGSHGTEFSPWKHKKYLLQAFGIELP